MSIKVASIVWENSRHKGSALLLLLAIADHAHDDGTGAWPSVEALAHKARMKERNVQTLLRKLEESGELKTVIAGGPHGCNAYAIQLDRVQGLAPVQKRVKRGANQRTKGVQPLAPEPLDKPSIEPSLSTGDAKNASQPPAPPVTFESLERMGDEPPQPLKDAAIQVFREVRGKNPPKETYAQIEEAVGCEPVSLDFWRRVLVEYAALGWNRQSVSGPLDWFRKRELPHVERKNGGGKGKSSLIETISAGFALYDEVVHGKRSDGQGTPFPDAIDVSPTT